MKPKIKFLVEKDTFVQDVSSLIPNNSEERYKSLQVRKSGSTFFKPMNKIDEVPEEKGKVEDAGSVEHNPDIKPVTQKIHSRSNYLRILHHNSFTTDKILVEQ